MAACVEAPIMRNIVQHGPSKRRVLRLFLAVIPLSVRVHTLKSHYHKNGCMGSSTNHEKYHAIWSFQNTGVKIMPDSDPFIYTRAPTHKFHHQVLQVN